MPGPQGTQGPPAGPREPGMHSQCVINVLPAPASDHAGQLAQTELLVAAGTSL